VSEIVEEDMSLLQSSDLVIGDLSCPRRSYIGAVGELLRAFDWGKETYVWVGSSRNEERVWLKYHATAICRTFEEIKELLYLTWTPAGREQNNRNVREYYSAVAPVYDKVSCLDHIPGMTSEEREQFSTEWRSLRKWVDGLRPAGTVMDLGSGTGRWVPVWLRSAHSIVCVDASPAMVSASIGSNGPAVSHFEGDVTNTEWLASLVHGLGKVDCFVLAFLLSSLTSAEQTALVRAIGLLGSRNSKLILIENQRSVFGSRDFFSRTEIQERVSPGGAKRFRMRKRNFLAHDARQALAMFGTVDSLFYTSNWFVAGVSSRQ
jgi:SAM-dependent methyltransferase